MLRATFCNARTKVIPSHFWCAAPCGTSLGERAYAVICIRGAKRSLEDLAYLILIPDVPNIHHYHHQHNITFRMGQFLIDNSVVADCRTRLVLLRLLIICVRHFFVLFFSILFIIFEPVSLQPPCCLCLKYPNILHFWINCIYLTYLFLTTDISS